MRQRQKIQELPRKRNCLEQSFFHHKKIKGCGNPVAFDFFMMFYIIQQGSIEKDNNLQNKIWQKIEVL